MLAEYRTKTNIGVGLGILLQLAGRLVARNEASVFGHILTLVGFVLFIWGCTNYAAGKGHSKFLGLLGILSCIGLIILVLLPDRHK
jgi:hypothetical protein